MKRILAHRKLFGVEKSASLKDLKTIYRNFMKEWHPDKFQGNEEGAADAERKSKSIIEAYHFLVSINPETHLTNKEKYTETISSASIENFNYKAETLQIVFSDGTSYEYFEVSKNTYTKFLNSDAQSRFARRHICTSHTYRDISNTLAAVAE